MNLFFRSICLLSFYLECAAAAECGLDENIDLYGAKITASSSVETKHAVDRNLLTHVDVNNTGIKWIIVQLRDSSSEYRFVKSMTVVPARPGYDKKDDKNCGTSDRKDTTICKFPFKHGGVTYHTCTLYEFKPINCRQYRCGAGSRGFHLDTYSSCESTQPNGILSDNIQVMLSSQDSINPPDWNKFQSCGSTGTDLFNSDRTVSCENTVLNTKNVAFNKDSADLQIAEIKITFYKHDRKLVNSNDPWKENSTRAQVLQISGCSPQFFILKIVWFQQTLDKSETKKLGETNGVVTIFKIPKLVITREHSGYYYFEYKNMKAETFFKSNIVKKQVYYKSFFTTKLKSYYCGRDGEILTIKCAVDFGYPYPHVTLTVGNVGHLSCIYTIKKDSYGGQSSECTTRLQLRANLHNSLIKCTSKQGSEYQEESSGKIHIVTPTPSVCMISTTTATTTTATTTISAKLIASTKEQPITTTSSRNTYSYIKTTPGFSSFCQQNSNNISLIATIPVLIVLIFLSIVITIFIMKRRFTNQIKLIQLQYESNSMNDNVCESNENQETIVEYEEPAETENINLENLQPIQILPNDDYEVLNYGSSADDSSKNKTYYEIVT